MWDLLATIGFWALFLPFATGAAITLSAIVCTQRRKMREFEANEREKERAHELLMLGGHTSPLSEAEGIKLRLEALEKEVAELRGGPASRSAGFSRIPGPSVGDTPLTHGAKQHLEETQQP